MSYIGNEPIVSATRTVTEISATAGQTTFTANGGYTVGKVDVIVNGSQLQSSDFTATDGSTVVLTSACAAGDDVKLVAWGTFSVNNLSGANINDASITAAKFASGQTPSFNGIAFPATQSASSDANTLDDYEEGTWTPTVGGNSSVGTATYSIQIGRYTKIGRLVNVSFMITTSSTISGSVGVILIYGLPFAVNSSTNLGGGGGSIGYINGLGSNIYTSTCYSDGGTSYVVPVYTANSGGATFWGVSAFQNGSLISGHFTYITS